MATMATCFLKKAFFLQLIFQFAYCRRVNLSSFTPEEAESERNPQLHIVDPIVDEFNRWFSYQGKGKMVKFQIGLAQEYATEFCRSERESLKGKRCSWEEYQALLTNILEPFSKTFDHSHYEGMMKEKDVMLSLPEIQPCSVHQGAPTVDEFLGYVVASKPMIFKGAAKEWPAIKKWSTEYLTSKLLNVTWRAAVSPNANFDVVEPGKYWRNQIMQSELYRNIQAESDLPNVLVRPGNVLLSTKQLFSAIKQRQRHPVVVQDMNNSEERIVQEKGVSKSSSSSSLNSQESSYKKMGSLSDLQRSLSMLKPFPQSQTHEDDNDKGHDVTYDVKEKGFVYVEYSTLSHLKRELMKNKRGVDIERDHLLKSIPPIGIMEKDVGDDSEFESLSEKESRLSEIDSFFSDLGPAFGDDDGFGDQKETNDENKEVEDMSFADFLHPTHRLLWIGTGGTLGNLHFDRNENIMTVIRGKKKFTIFDPLQYEYLYGGESFVEAHYDAQVIFQEKRNNGNSGGNSGDGSRSDDEFQEVEDVEVLSWRPSDSRKLKVEQAISMSAYSPVNISSPHAYAKFPKFKQATKHECHVEEGDMLYLPARWWHEVESYPDDEGKTVAVNFWYKPWYHKAAYQDRHELVIRNEFYAHLHGERQQAYPCHDDQSLVCFNDHSENSIRSTSTATTPRGGSSSGIPEALKTSDTSHEEKKQVLEVEVNEAVWI